MDKVFKSVEYVKFVQSIPFVKSFKCVHDDYKNIHHVL